MNYYEHHLGDYASHTAHLSLVEDACYSRMLRRYYLTEQALPPDVDQVCRLIGARTEEERAAAVAVLAEFFRESAEGYRHDRCDREIARYRERSEKAKASVAARERYKAERSSNDDRTMIERSSHQTPDTRLHTPEDQKLSTPNGVDVAVTGDPCPISKIVDLYHEALPDLPKVRKLTAARAQHIRARWREDLPDLRNWSNFFAHVGQSDFLMGRAQPVNGRPAFVADLAWLTKAENFAKIAEGKYHRG